MIFEVNSKSYTNKSLHTTSLVVRNKENITFRDMLETFKILRLFYGNHLYHFQLTLAILIVSGGKFAQIQIKLFIFNHFQITFNILILLSQLT